MASIFKRPGSANWFAAYDVPQPDATKKRVKVTTSQRKKGLALTEALRLESVALAGATVTGDAATKSFAPLKEAAASVARGDWSEAKAREMLAQITESATGEALRFFTPRTWAAEWLANKKASAKASTCARYKTSTEAFVDWLKGKADSRLEAITKADVRRFRDDIRAGWEIAGQPRSARTSNYYASDVAAMFRAAVREGLLLSSPALGLVKLPEDDSTEREVFTIAEIGQLIGKAGGPEWQRRIYSAANAQAEIEAARCRDWQGLILVGFYAGPRLKDAARLLWSNVDLERGTLSFMPRKTERKKMRLQVPIHPRLAAFLATHDVPRDAHALVFPALAGLEVGGKTGLSSQFIAIMTEAEVDRRTSRESVLDAAGKAVRRAQHSRSFHALRHSLTSSLANLDVPEEIRRRIVGHDSAAVHAGYTHHDRETTTRAMDKLPSV
jgi:integrase